VRPLGSFPLMAKEPVLIHSPETSKENSYRAISTSSGRCSSWPGIYVLPRGVFADDALVYGVLGWGKVDDVLPIWEQLVNGLAMICTSKT
jgi:hypothetical protein